MTQWEQPRMGMGMGMRWAAHISKWVLKMQYRVLVLPTNSTLSAILGTYNHLDTPTELHY